MGGRAVPKILLKFVFRISIDLFHKLVILLASPSGVQAELPGRSERAALVPGTENEAWGSTELPGCRAWKQAFVHRPHVSGLWEETGSTGLIGSSELVSQGQGQSEENPNSQLFGNGC